MKCQCEEPLAGPQWKNAEIAVVHMALACSVETVRHERHVCMVKKLLTALFYARAWPTTATEP